MKLLQKPKGLEKRLLLIIIYEYVYLQNWRNSKRKFHQNRSDCWRSLCGGQVEAVILVPGHEFRQGHANTMSHTYKKKSTYKAWKEIFKHYQNEYFACKFSKYVKNVHDSSHCDFAVELILEPRKVKKYEEKNISFSRFLFLCFPAEL